MKIPRALAHVFWDCDLNHLDPHEHISFVLGRLMSRTEETIIRWLWETYTADMLRAYLFHDGARKLGPRELEYWCAALEVAEPFRTQWLAAARARVNVTRTADP